jgi:hypothetical protein
LSSLWPEHPKLAAQLAAYYDSEKK